MSPKKNAEQARLADPAWKRWGPYLAERAWGTVREDYSPNGDAWSYFPHEQARSRTYRWNEDGMAGICDEDQVLCFALALWNGKDPILKERMFGLTNSEANHGEDPKEYWFYEDSTPTHSWMRWRYMYPQEEFPYEELLKVNRERLRTEPEYELVDTGLFDDGRFWDVTVDYAKAEADDICIRVSVRNAGDQMATIDVLPTLWFRNTWSWGIDDRKPELRATGNAIVASHHDLGAMTLSCDGAPELLFCENESNLPKLWRAPGTTPYPKDGINDHVVDGAATVNPAGTGTKAAARYRLSVAGGDTAEVTLRLAPEERPSSGKAFTAVLDGRRKEADAFYAALTPKEATEDEALVMRQAFSGMLWGKQWFHYDVERWLDGDPQPPPPPENRRYARNAHWDHIRNHDVISMPDKWEYPWYAVWDSAFHCVPLAYVDPQYAKDQLLLFLNERYLHPNGQIPAYEWNFSDVNPPVHAWAVLKVFDLDGRKDLDFLARAFHKLILNFTWWVNKKDRDGNNVFEGGFLGLDNIGPIDRSAGHEGVHLEQSDGTAWMAMFSLNLMKIALLLAERDRSYEDIASKFFEHFCRIAASINAPGGLWDDDEGFYYDLLHRDDGPSVPLPVRSMVGLITLYAVEVLDSEDVSHLQNFTDSVHWFMRTRSWDDVSHVEIVDSGGKRLLSIVGPERLPRILERVLDAGEFLSDYGVRALSRFHLDSPVHVEIGHGQVASVGYEPSESSSPMFGGNSNWRGPIWFPVNYMILESLLGFHAFLGDDFKVEHPRGSGQMRTLQQVSDELASRLVSIFTKDASGRRAVFGGTELFQNDPTWNGLIPFYEYFHGDDGAGVGASHQTGWTGLVADLIASGRGLSSRSRS